MNKSKFSFFKKQPIKLLNKYERWKKTAEKLKLSKEAKQRLSWIIYYHTKASKNASLTCRHYGIARKTFYKWLNQFDEDNLCTLKNLENKSKTPKNFRQREITYIQEQRIIKLRKKYIRYGKLKLQKIY